MIKKQIDLTIFGNKYPCIFPNTGNFMDIQILKAKITENFYDSLKMLERDGMIASIICDAIAHFSVLIPDLKKDLNVTSFLLLDLDKIIEMSYVYKDTFFPWFNDLMEQVTAPKVKPTEEIKDVTTNTTTASA